MLPRRDPARVKIFVAQLGWELRKVFMQPRAWLGFGVVALYEIVFASLLQLPSVRSVLMMIPARMGYQLADNFTGLTAAQNIVGQTGILMALFCALIAGESIAGEDERGTLRALLSRPVSRVRLWTIKLLACAIFTGALVVFATIVALALGLATEGSGPLFVVNYITHQRALYAFGDGLFLYAWGAVFHTLSSFTVTAVAFALSGMCRRGAVAAVIALGYFLADELLRNQPFFAALRDWFVMSHVTSWIRVYDASPGWGWAVEVYAPLVIADAIALALGAIVFCRRSFKP
jgi:ABC-2 type transport system permease protein